MDFPCLLSFEKNKWCFRLLSSAKCGRKIIHKWQMNKRNFWNFFTLKKRKKNWTQNVIDQTYLIIKRMVILALTHFHPTKFKWLLWHFKFHEFQIGLFGKSEFGWSLFHSSLLRYKILRVLSLTFLTHKEFGDLENVYFFAGKPLSLSRSSSFSPLKDNNHDEKNE